jgi:DNA-binding transcriptional MocR family regulator
MGNVGTMVADPARNLSRRMDRVAPNAVGELLRAGANPTIISFAGGYPDGTLFPAEKLGAIYAEIVRDMGPSALQYTVSDGMPELRQQIAERLAAQGTACDAENVLILQGSQQGLDLMAKMVIDPGDLIITERPTFLGAIIAFDPFGPRYRGIPMDRDGMRMEVLEAVLQKDRGAKFIYTIPDFQNPSGVSMSAARRKHLVELANEYDVIVLEDTAYREVRFEGETPPTIKSFDTQGRVVMLGSFSKILSPGMRLGYAVASGTMLEKLSVLKLAADTQCSTVNMMAASLFLERHDMDAHVETLRSAYRRKKNLMLSMIRQHFPQEVTATDPEGGLFTWASFPEGLDTQRFMREQALPHARVAYVPGASFFCERPEVNHVRFNYSGQSDARIEEGMKALGRVLKEAFVGRTT